MHAFKIHTNLHIVLTRQLFKTETKANCRGLKRLLSRYWYCLFGLFCKTEGKSKRVTNNLKNHNVKILLNLHNDSLRYPFEEKRNSRLKIIMRHCPNLGRLILTRAQLCLTKELVSSVWPYYFNIDSVIPSSTCENVHIIS